MKLLIATGLYPPDIGGPATYSKILEEELPKHDIEVEVLSFGSVRKLPKVIRHIVYFFKVLKLGRTADVIFAQDPISVGLPAMLAAKILRKKFILKIVGDYAWEQGVQRFGVEELLDIFLLKKDYPWQVKLLRWMEKLVAEEADKIITPSEYLKTVVIKWGVDVKKISVVYNAVEFGAVDPIKHDGERWIVSVGRLVPWKGFNTLIEIMPSLCHSRETCPRAASGSGDPEIKLKIIGSGPDFEKLKLQVISYKLQDSVELLGGLLHNETLSYIKSADVFILNSGYEGLSHVILEALSFGVPVLASNVGGNPELLSKKNLFTYRDKKEILEKINRVLEDKNGYLIDKQVLEKFKLETIIDKTIKVLCAS